MRPLFILTLLSLLACGDSSAPGNGDFPLDGEGGKTDVFGRALVGRPQPYPADPTLAEAEETLRTEMAARRNAAWEIVERALTPVPLLGLADRAEAEEMIELPDGEVPTVARFQTWYGVDDFKRMFQQLYSDQDRAARLRHDPFTEEQIDEAEELNANAIDRSSRWPLERFLNYVNRLGVCDEGLSEDECARRLQSGFSGASIGNARITYAPATIRHLLANHAGILDCLETLDELSLDATPDDDANFTTCFEQEMPADAVLVKAQWVRSDLQRDMPAYDTSAESLAELLGPTNSGTWPVDGHRRADPSDEDIVTIRLRNGSTYRLAGMHIMTKELRHWTWVSLFWSDEPDLDFGEDRPDAIRALAPVWSNYKMCVVVDYEEGDRDPGAGLERYPTLAAALRAVPTEMASWCSNPYVEEGRGNARTNCIGCHQHGGSTVAHDLNGDGTPDAFDLDSVISNEDRYPLNGRTQIREIFPADYLFSANRVDNLFQVIRSEVDRATLTDGRAIDMRADAILGIDERDASRGASLFAANCARCHGADGTGDFGPNLYDRVPMRDDDTLVRRLLLGLGPMPAWDSVFDDQELADLMAFLRATFDAPAGPTEVRASADGLPTAIPDDDMDGVASTIDVAASFEVRSVRVEVDITHPYRGDLQVELVHGDTTVVLHDQTGAGADDLSVDAMPEEFASATSAGAWTLRVRDLASGDEGELTRFALTLLPF